MRTQCFDSRFVYFWKVIHTAVQQMTPRSNHQQKHSTFVRSGNGEQRFPGLGSLKLYSSCYQLFVLSFFTVKLHSYTVKYMFWIFLPSGIQSGEETDVGKQRLNRALESLSSLSLVSFSELNKALDTNEYNWWRVFIFLPQGLQIRCDLSSARNILFARTKSNKLPRLLWGLKQVFGTNLIPLRPNLSNRRSGCQLGLLWGFFLTFAFF